MLYNIGVRIVRNRMIKIPLCKYLWKSEGVYAVQDQNDGIRKTMISKKNTDAPRRQSFLVRLIIKLAVIVTFVGCIGMTIYLQSTVAEKEKKYNILQEQIDELKIRNEELNLTLNSDDIEAYMEQLAIEKYGYAYPDEIRYYDKSRS